MRALSGEDVCSNRLLNLGLTKQHLLFRLLVAGLDLDDLATRNHANMLQLDLNVVVGQHHADERGVEATDTANVVLGSPCLDQAPDRSARVHAVGNGTGEVGIAGKHPRDVDGVVIARDACVGLVRGRCTQLQRRLPAEGDGVLEVDRLLDRRTMALQVVHDRVAVRLSGFIVNAGYLDDFLRRELEEDLAPGLNAAEHRLVLVANQALQAESERLPEKLNVRVLLVKREPLLRPENGNILARGQMYLHRSLSLPLERVLVISVRPAVQELRRDLHDRCVVANDGTANLHHLARILVQHSVDLSHRGNHVTLLEWLCTRHHPELVGEMHELQEITVDNPREDRLRDRLPAHHDREIHGRVHCLAGPVNEGLTRVPNSVDELVDGVTSHNRLAAVKLPGDWSVEVEGLIAEPCTPVELFDAVVTAFHDLVDRRITCVRVVDEAKRKGNRLAEGSGILDHVDNDLVLAGQLDLDDFGVLVVP